MSTFTRIINLELCGLLVLSKVHSIFLLICLLVLVNILACFLVFCFIFSSFNTLKCADYVPPTSPKSDSVFLELKARVGSGIYLN